MSKKVLTALVAAVFAMSCMAFTGCGSGSASNNGSNTSATNAGSAAMSASSSSTASSSSSQAASASERKDLVISDSGYSVSSSGYIHWGATIENPNTDWGATFPKINIVGKDADGKVLFTDSQTLKEIYPGEAITYGTQAGKGTAPATVEFTASVDSKNWKQTNTKRENLYTIENLNDAAGTFGPTFTGEITLNSEVKGAYKPALTVILRDEAGQIIYGHTTFQQTELSVGVPTPFEISGFSVPDAYATVEVYATPWM